MLRLSFLLQLKRTSIRRQRIAEIRVPPGTLTRVRVNNHKHRLWPGPQELLTYRCQAQAPPPVHRSRSYGRAVCTKVGSADP
ncbi:hypothetical protein NHX12_001343 [Muraenolepis orangiensis]|uniref:Uncharacterized protein n=1 Tax=Muraenolepis orangiensis TaxID=630683 RepID=A0A9Q0E1W9_9TELE|nr:hypothetical protein NHX12_001343 [Muraenolepis orangiensis]